MAPFRGAEGLTYFIYLFIYLLFIQNPKLMADIEGRSKQNAETMPDKEILHPASA